ncbi:MAG TPA: CBS domain-containing protein [Chromatiaceae bacterium]|nr:CBS domain-containing protein [Chromatiaceae bacterium]
MSLGEEALSGLAALGGIGLVMLVSSFFLEPRDLPWVVASMGASAVLLFAVPLGPLSQPWPFAGGHLISGLIGVTLATLIQEPVLAAALAVSLAIFVMYVTGCLHPPGGATALTVVAGGDAIRAMGYEYLLTPVLANIVVMLAWALLINNLLPNRYYPNTLRRLKEETTCALGTDRVDARLCIGKDDLEFALREMNEYVDVSREELSRIFNLSATHARRRRMGEILCGEIMTRDVVSAEYDDKVEDIWKRMWQHKIRSVPIIDARRHVIGIVTIADFLNQVKAEDERPLAKRLRAFIRPSSGSTTDKPEFAGHIMTTPVITIREDQHILDLFPVFYEKGVHHLPVVDSEDRLVGMLTPKNLMPAERRWDAAFAMSTMGWTR